MVLPVVQRVILVDAFGRVGAVAARRHNGAGDTVSAAPVVVVNNSVGRDWRRLLSRCGIDFLRRVVARRGLGGEGFWSSGFEPLALRDQALDVGKGVLGIVHLTVDPAGGLSRLGDGDALVVEDGRGGGRDQEDGDCNVQGAESGAWVGVRSGAGWGRKLAGEAHGDEANDAHIIGSASPHGNQ